MKKQFVYLGRGVNIYYTAPIKNWLSKNGETLYTTDYSISDDLTKASLFCIPEGDVDKIAKSITPFIKNMIQFINNGGTLLTICGGSHALARTNFYNLIDSKIKLVDNIRISDNSQHLYTSTISIKNPNNNCKTNPVNCYICCDSCANDRRLKKYSISYIFDNDTYILGIHAMSKNPAIVLKYINRGILLSMTVIPMDEKNVFDFVLDCMSIYNNEISNYWINSSNSLHSIHSISKL